MLIIRFFYKLEEDSSGFAVLLIRCFEPRREVGANLSKLRIINMDPSLSMMSRLDRRVENVVSDFSWEKYSHSTNECIDEDGTQDESKDEDEDEDNG